jgi:hypothetical protein
MTMEIAPEGGLPIRAVTTRDRLADPFDAGVAF